MFDDEDFEGEFEGETDFDDFDYCPTDEDLEELAALEEFGYGSDFDDGEDYAL